MLPVQCTQAIHTRRDASMFYKVAAHNDSIFAMNFIGHSTDGLFLAIQTNFQHVLWLKKKEHTLMNFPTIFQLNNPPLEGAPLLIIAKRRSSKIITLQHKQIFTGSCQIAFVVICLLVVPSGSQTLWFTRKLKLTYKKYLS